MITARMRSSHLAVSRIRSSICCSVRMFALFPILQFEPVTAVENSSHLAWQGILRLRIDPFHNGCICLQVQSTHEDFAQPLIVAKEVGPVLEPVPLPE